MGEFTQNLLKLTEFPFSYSLLGMIALIFGHGINLENPSFTEVGPLLILMGFVATTLSICDPIGALQRWIIKGRKLPKFTEIGDDYFNTRIFRKRLFEVFPPNYIFAIAFSPSEINNRYKGENKIDWKAVEDFSSEVTEFSRKKISEEEFEKKRKSLFTPSERAWILVTLIDIFQIVALIAIFPFTFLATLVKYFAEGFAEGFKESLGKGGFKESLGKEVGKPVVTSLKMKKIN
jgi:hypothetical protein